MKFINCFQFFWVIALLDPDPDWIVNPDPEHWKKLEKFLFGHNNLEIRVFPLLQIPYILKKKLLKW